MATTFQWQDHIIAIDSFFSSRYLFHATENVLRVDGAEVARSGGFSFTEVAAGQFQSGDGSAHSIELQTNASLFTVTSCPYVIRVDGRVIAQGRSSADNAGVAFLVAAVIWGLIVGIPAVLLLESMIAH